uniref:Uncharacterized protein n=1 Tax=Tetranychus urticae TaxID=32264 RepID=T1K2B4_TETUR
MVNPTQPTSFPLQGIPFYVNLCSSNTNLKCTDKCIANIAVICHGSRFLLQKMITHALICTEKDCFLVILWQLKVTPSIIWFLLTLYTFLILLVMNIALVAGVD